MGKRSAGVGVWLVIGALVLLAMVPKEVWIGLGVIGGIALVVYLAIKHMGQKASAPKGYPNRDAHRHEPTLAELIAANESQQSKQSRPPKMGRIAFTAPVAAKLCQLQLGS